MVVVYEGRPGTPPRKMWRRALDTGDDGAFAIDLHVASRYVLVGMAYGFAPSAPLSFEVLDARRPPDITLAVQALAEVRGVVVDDAGAPRSGGRIDAMLPFDQSGAAPPWSQEGERNPTAVVEQDGSFVLAGALPDRTYTLIYEPGDGRPTRASWRGIRPNDGPLVLTARDDELRCGFVGGSVRDAGGAPLTRYQITIGRSTGRIDASTGRFEMQVKWGTEAPVLVQVGARPVVFEIGTCRIDREAQELTLQLAPPRPHRARARRRRGSRGRRVGRGRARCPRALRRGILVVRRPAPAAQDAARGDGDVRRAGSGSLSHRSDAVRHSSRGDRHGAVRRGVVGRDHAPGALRARGSVRLGRHEGILGGLGARHQTTLSLSRAFPQGITGEVAVELVVVDLHRSTIRLAPGRINATIPASASSS